MSKELKEQFSQLMHEIMIKNREIVDQGDYSNLLNLCEQDITILAFLQGKENITAKGISDRLSVPKTTIVTAISRLVKRGYIDRIENEKDRREKYLILTEKGKKANKEHFQFEDIFLEDLVNRWDKEDQKVLARLLMKRGDF